MTSHGAVAVFGGTFNPIHFGHLRSAVELVDALPITRMHFVPAAWPAHREAPEVSAEHRAAMVELAIAGEARFVCDRRELEREGPSYSYNTLASLREELGDRQSLCLVLGCDALLGLTGWYRWKDLLSLAHITVIARPGWSMPTSGELARYIAPRLGSEANLADSPRGSIVLQSLRPLDISATEIRGLLQSQQSPRYLLPDNVLDYIHANALYAETAVTYGS